MGKEGKERGNEIAINSTKKLGKCPKETRK